MIKIKTNNVRNHFKNDSVSVTEIFSVPVYEKRFAEHNVFKNTIMDYLLNDELYSRNTSRETLKFTHPNLHKMTEFQTFVAFINESVSEVFTDLGFVPSFEITGLWATRQNMQGSYHHRHIHHNSFISGVYYLNGTSGITKGTNFFSDWKDPLILPAVINQRSVKINSVYETSFEEGKAVIFPSWIEHGTPFNPDDSERVILSFNCMPVGKTNTDPFERYNYQSVQDADLINYNDEKYK